MDGKLSATNLNLTTMGHRKIEPRQHELAAAARMLAIGLLTLTASVSGQETQAVATVDGQVISAQELSNADTAQMLPLRSQEFQVQTRALEKLIRQKLLESAAKKRGESTDAFLAEEVDRTLAQPTDAEVLAYYLAQPERGRRPFLEAKGQLQEALHKAQVQYARDAYLDRLRSQADVAVLLNPSRARVSYDAARLKGTPNAPVMIVEFADFQCPYCRQEEGALKSVLAKYGNAVALAYRDYPVSQLHQFAGQAAEASHCAAEQGSYWQFHDMLMTGKPDSLSLKQDAHTLKLDEKQFDSCLETGRFKDAVEHDRQDAERLGVTSTPTFFINGIAIVGAETEASLSRSIEQELAQQKGMPAQQ
jgi:protein-disulfide isomerase